MPVAACSTAAGRATARPAVPLAARIQFPAASRQRAAQTAGPRPRQQASHPQQQLQAPQQQRQVRRCRKPARHRQLWPLAAARARRKRWHWLGLWPCRWAAVCVSDLAALPATLLQPLRLCQLRSAASTALHMRGTHSCPLTALPCAAQGLMLVPHHSHDRHLFGQVCHGCVAQCGMDAVHVNCDAGGRVKTAMLAGVRATLQRLEGV